MHNSEHNYFEHFIYQGWIFFYGFMYRCARATNVDEDALQS